MGIPLQQTLTENKTEPNRLLSGKSAAEKKAFLIEHDIDNEKVPQWQKKWNQLLHASVRHEGFNPITKQTVTTTRNCIAVQYDMPDGTEYDNLIGKLIEDSILEG